jgi:hypothetical protein
MTPAMWATPRERLWCRALRGHWERFPVSPASAHARFADQVARARRRGRGGYGIAQALQGLLDGQDQRLTGDAAARLALWRGLLTAGIEAFGEVRDRDGELAGFLGGWLAAYARLPWQPTGIEAEVYFADLCERVCGRTTACSTNGRSPRSPASASSTTTWSRGCCGSWRPS